MRQRCAVNLSIHEELSPVEACWRQFEHHGHCTVFQTFDWVSAWQHHIGVRINAKPAVVVGRRQADDELLFLLPLSVEPGWFGRLTWLGSRISDYNGPLLSPRFSSIVSPDHFVEIWRQICALLKRMKHLEYQLIDLAQMPEMIGSQRNPFLQLGTYANPSGAHVAHLSAMWDDFYQSKRSPGARKRDRNTTKRLSRYGEIRLVCPSNSHDAFQTLEKLFEQKSLWFRRRGITDLFERPGYRDFFRSLTTEEGSRRIAHISRLEIGNTWAATSFGLTFRDTYYHVLCSYEAGDISRFGPGNAHLRELLKYSIERRLQRFDFTVGDEPYKLAWADTHIALRNHTSSKSILGWPLVVAMIGLRKLKRVIKQSQLLWCAYCCMRAALVPILFYLLPTASLLSPYQT